MFQGLNHFRTALAAVSPQLKGEVEAKAGGICRLGTSEGQRRCVPRGLVLDQRPVPWVEPRSVIDGRAGPDECCSVDPLPA